MVVPWACVEAANAVFLPVAALDSDIDISRPTFTLGADFIRLGNIRLRAICIPHHTTP